MGHLNYLQKKALGIQMGGDMGTSDLAKNASCSNIKCSSSLPTSITIQRIVTEKKHGETKPTCSVKTGK
jgi:hypothetical protein